MTDITAEFSRILLIDDDVEACMLLRDYLEPYNFSVSFAHTGREGLNKMLAGDYDLILLDIFLPDMGGLEVLRRSREFSSLPVVILSAHNDEADHVAALEMGADDYIPKSFSSRKLLAHIRAVQRRVQEKNEERLYRESGAGLISIRGMKIYTGSMKVELNGEAVELTTSEFRLLHLLASTPGRIFTREELLENVADRSYSVYDRSIDVFISSLRQKLGDDPKNPQWIRTLRSAGYMFIP